MREIGVTTVAMARSLIGEVTSVFEAAVSKAALSASIDGKLDVKRLDDMQVLCFDFAWINADLLAAKATLAALDEPDVQELDRRLSLTFVTEAIGTILPKLESVLMELDAPADALHVLAASSEWRVLRHSSQSGAALAQTGADVCEHGGEIGQVRLGDEHQMVQDQFRRFAADVVAPLAESIHREDLTVPETLLQPLREMGVFGLSIPERYGGHAPDDREDSITMIIATEALSEASLGAAGSLITRPEILSRALLAGGTEEQKQHWLPKLAAGKPLCAIGITEPDHGSDVASVVLRGTRTQGGWLINGAKTWCTFAGKAGVIMLVTRTDPDRSLGFKGLSLLLAEKPSHDGHDFDCRQEGGGRLVGRAIATIGYRGMHSYDLSFENYFVPDANVIGGEAGLGKGFYFTMSGMMGGRMQTAARSCGVMRAALRASIRYASERKVFGAPLGSYQLTAAKLARMAARFAACRQLTYQVGPMLDAGNGRMEASLVKLLACRSAEMITREAVQIFGGMGYAEESAVSRYFVDARVLSIFEGAEETLALKVVARSLLENALQESS